MDLKSPSRSPSLLTLINITNSTEKVDILHKNAHVMAAMIKKFCIAKRNKNPNVTFWGSGNALREFLYSDDVGRSSNFMHGKKHKNNIINISSGKQISLKNLAEMIKSISNYYGQIKWDNTKPVGSLEKTLNINHIDSLGWKPKVSLKEGIKRTITYYENSQ